MSLPEQAGQVASSAVDAMKSTPLAIALLVVNICFLAFTGYILKEVAANAAERNRTQLELISQLVGDLRNCGQAQAPKSMLYLPSVKASHRD